MSEKIVECSVCGKIHKVCSDHILERTFIPHEVTCPTCGKVFILKWQAAQARQKENVDESYCAKCLQKHTTLRLYGVEYSMQSPEVAAKFKATCLKKYGTPSPLNKECSVRIEHEKEFKEGSIKGGQGRESPFKDPLIREKARKVIKEKYGVDNVMKSDEVKSRFQKTMIEKYGSPWAMQSEQLKQRMSDSCLKNNGAPWPAQSPEIRKQMSQTCFEKYGTIHPNVGPQSKEEKGIFDYIKSLGFSPVSGFVDWGTGTQEIDIFIPELKVGFEYNGLYFHSTACKVNPLYHHEKSVRALNSGIKLYHLWSRENLSLIKSIVASKLGKCKKLYARNFKVKSVSTVEANDFYNKNHIQGSVGVNSFHYGLFDESTLISCMSFRTFHPGIVELSRFATQQFTQVIGGFSKLWSYFERHNTKYLHAVSFAMRDICPVWQETVYAKTGWTKTLEYSNQLFYTDCTRVFNRQNFMKQKLKDLWEWKPEYDSMTEVQICQEHGIYAVYNSGCWKFEKDLVLTNQKPI